MIFLFNVFFRFLHMLMMFLPPQSAVTPWLRQRAEDALLMRRVAADRQYQPHDGEGLR